MAASRRAVAVFAAETLRRTEIRQRGISAGREDPLRRRLHTILLLLNVPP
jgi:hypothetical protein